MSRLDVDKVVQMGSILGVWAHPDDETYSMGGLMAAAVQNGQFVSCITATKGEAGVQDESRWPAGTLGETRAAELKEALEILGVYDHTWLDYPDGGCQEVNQQEAIQRIVQQLDKCKPETVITFPPDGLTGHPDHVAVSGWVEQALAAWKGTTRLYYAVNTLGQYDAFIKDLDQKFNIYFNIEQPKLLSEEECDLVLRLPVELAAIKFAALEKMPSQTAIMIEEFGHDAYQAGLGTEAFVLAEREIQWGKPREIKSGEV